MKAVIQKSDSWLSRIIRGELLFSEYLDYLLNTLGSDLPIYFSVFVREGVGMCANTDNTKEGIPGSF